MTGVKWPWRNVPQEDDVPRGNFAASVALSATFHLSVILACLFGLRLMPPAELPPVAKVVLVNLVTLGDLARSPSADERAEIPQQQAAEHSPSPDPRAVPRPQSPPAEKLLRPAERAAPAATGSQAAAAAAKSAQPADELSARLQQLAKLSQPVPSQPPTPREQEGAGASNRTAVSDAPSGEDAIYRVKDYLRAQIERRWNVAVSSAPGLRASIHLEISPDGTVQRAEIVDDPTRRYDKTYEAFARSARNAAVLSSPLTLLPGSYPIAKDIVIDFDARRLVR